MSARKRTKVPAALHSELSEYSSLLRALRTSNTLDLASQLTAHATSQSTVSGDRKDEAHDGDDASLIDDDGESERPRTESTSKPADALEKAGDDASTAGPKTNRKWPRKNARDTWTRWPLLAGDVHVPEWSLEDEVRLLAGQCLKPQPETSNELDSSDVEDTVDPLLTPHALSALTASTGRYLSEILALLAAYVPPSGGSMQNRVRPMNWESVLAIAAANGLISSECVRKYARGHDP